MKIDFTIDNGILNVALDGRLDTITAPELEKFLGEKCAEADMLIFDCEKLAYISSAGLRVLLAAQKKTEPKSIPWTQKVELLSPCTIARRCVS